MSVSVLRFRVREVGDIHPHTEVAVAGSGANLAMHCQCLASLHGALLCPHILAVIKEDRNLVRHGQEQFASLRTRLVDSVVLAAFRDTAR